MFQLPTRHIHLDVLQPPESPNPKVHLLSFLLSHPHLYSKPSFPLLTAPFSILMSRGVTQELILVPPVYPTHIFIISDSAS